MSEISFSSDARIRMLRATYLWGAFFIIVSFSRLISRVAWGGLGRLDELIILLFLGVLVVDAVLVKRLEKVFGYYLLTISIIVVVSILVGRNRSLQDVVIQAILMSKAYIFLFFSYKYLNQEVTLKFFKALLVLSFLGALANILSPGTFVALGLNETIREEFSSINRVGGFQLNANRLAHLLALLPLASASMLGLQRNGYVILLVVAAITLLFTGGRLGMALFGFGLGLKFLEANKPGFREVIIMTVMLPAVILLAYAISDIVFKTRPGDSEIGYFRFMLLGEAIKLAFDYFPFGSGLATYGTPFAYDVGVYQETKIANTFFYRLDTALYDNNLASIIGEVGIFLGAALIFLLIRIVWLFRYKFSKLSWIGLMVFLAFSLQFESFLSNSICVTSLAMFLTAVRPIGAKQVSA